MKQKFTGYERDDETGLDFAEARYCSSGQGRFTSPDPLISSAITNDPQSWNRYSYVGNRPTVTVDPTGLRWAMQNTSAGIQYQWFNTDEEYTAALANGWEIVDFDESESYRYRPDPAKGAIVYQLNPDGTHDWAFEADASNMMPEQAFTGAVGGVVFGRAVGWLVTNLSFKFVGGAFAEGFGEFAQEASRPAVTAAGNAVGEVFGPTYMYGPFHRFQDAALTELMESTGFVGGQAPRNIYSGLFPQVKAYSGPLPEGAAFKGIEFYTPLKPTPTDIGGVGVRWIQGEPGVVNLGEGVVGIPGKIVKKTN